MENHLYCHLICPKCGTSYNYSIIKIEYFKFLLKNHPKELIEQRFFCNHKIFGRISIKDYEEKSSTELKEIYNSSIYDRSELLERDMCIIKSSRLKKCYTKND